MWILSRPLLCCLALGLAAGCATLQEIASLRSVNFELDRVAGLRLAGVEVSRIRSASELNLGDAARIAAAVASRELPLAFDLHLRAENPAGNRVTARLVQMRWTLYLEGVETISGLIDREYAFPPGQPIDLPIEIALDLVDFYERSGPDLIDLALNLAGEGGEPKQLTLRAVPTIETALGPIAYPRPITIVSRAIGQQ